MVRLEPSWSGTRNRDTDYELYKKPESGQHWGNQMFIEAIYRRERDPYVEYRYRIEIVPGEIPQWSARIWRSEDYLGTASGTVASPPRDEILLKTLIEEEVREIIETRYSLF